MKRNDPFAKIDPFLGIRPMHTQKQQRPYAHSNVIPSSMTTERDPKIVETSHKLGVGSIPFAAWRVPRIDYVNTHTKRNGPCIRLFESDPNPVPDRVP